MHQLVTKDQKIIFHTILIAQNYILFQKIRIFGQKKHMTMVNFKLPALS